MMVDWPEGDGPKVAVFGFDVAESSQIRRIRALIELGCRVVSFTQRRGNMNRDFQPEWPNVHLGDVENENHLRRARQVASGMAIAARHWRLLSDADLVIARNFDLAAMAIGARRIAALRARRQPAPFVYECLDIHSLFTRGGRLGQAMRMAERRVLAASSAIVISSPAFQREYFAKMQGWSGPSILVENKLYLGDAPDLRAARPVSRPARPDGAPLTIGLVGSIRCAPSLQILAGAADRMGDALRVRFHGNVHEHAVPDFHDIVNARHNIDYYGAYSYPRGLLGAYEDCDLVWAQDLWQSGANSDWLLPNRIYEASWAGCPQIAVETTETGRRVREDRLGFTVPRADPEALVDLLTTLTPERIRAASDLLLQRDAGDFVQSPADLAPVLEFARPSALR